MALSVCGRPLLRLAKAAFQTQYRTSYYILLPELGQKETEKLKYSLNDSLPDFRNLSFETCANIIENACLDYNVGLKHLERQIRGREIKDVFKEVLDALEKLNVSLESTWGVIKVLFTVDQSIISPEFFQSLSRKIEECRANRFISVDIYKACKACDTSLLTEEQARVVEKYLLEGKLNGMELQLNDSKNLVDFNAQLNTIRRESKLFYLHYEKASTIFKHTIMDPYSVKELPREILETMVEPGNSVEKGPWHLTLTPILKRKFLEYCPDRDLRWNFWQAEERVSSMEESDSSIRNSQCLEGIRKARTLKANSIGYPTFLHESLETKMAGSIENIEDTLYYLLEKAKPQQDMEVDYLQSFIKASGQGHPIQLFDLPYWARIQKKALLNYDEEEQKVYFPLSTVFEGMLNFCSKLFHISFKEVSNNISTWHPDVKFYHVYRDEETKPCGAFYTDFYRRDVKLFYGSDIGWAVPIRDHSLVPVKSLPLSALIFNFDPPVGKRPSLLTFSSVRQLFAKFALILQNTLCDAGYSDVSGTSNVEWEAVEAVSHFLVSWLYDETVFASINGHYQTGEKLNLPLKSVQQHMSGFKLCHELYKSNLDIKMHSTDKFWRDIVHDLWPQHYSFPLSKWNSYPCQFLDVFCGQWAAAYYCHVWSQILAADMLTAFHEENQDIESTGLRFRDTFLAFGGSCHASEVFRRFRGRDANPSALLKQLGLIVG